MITQHEYVAGCLAWYKEADLQPGNPEDGVWHEAHYPVPRCLGGTEVILLLKEHHAVQGVLQSEEFQYPCIFGWELVYIPRDYNSLFEKWNRRRQRIGWEAMRQIMTPEKKREALIRMRDTVLKRDPHHYSKMGKKARVKETQEVRSARGHMLSKEARDAGRNKTNSRKFRCLVTGKVSTAGPLTLYQRKRNIDTNLREEIPND